MHLRSAPTSTLPGEALARQAATHQPTHIGTYALPALGGQTAHIAGYALPVSLRQPCMSDQRVVVDG
jgi:hypothetical protein